MSPICTLHRLVQTLPWALCPSLLTAVPACSYKERMRSGAAAERTASPLPALTALMLGSVAIWLGTAAQLNLPIPTVSIWVT